MILIVAYDIPAAVYRASQEARKTLHRLGYSMIQKSVYIAHGGPRLAAETWRRLRAVAREAKGTRLLLVMASPDDVKALNPAAPVGRAWILYAPPPTQPHS